MSYLIKKGATSQSIELYIVDATDGTPETGVAWDTAGIDLKYRRKDAVAVSITEAALTTPALTDTWETGGFLEIGNGVYRLDLPDAAIASVAGIDRVVVFGTVTGMVVLPVTIHLTALDMDTAIPTAAANATAVWGEAAGGAAEDSYGNILDDLTEENAVSFLYEFTAGALVNGSAGSAASIAEAVWDALLNAHGIDGSAGRKLGHLKNGRY